MKYGSLLMSWWDKLTNIQGKEIRLMKRLLLVLMSVVMLFSITACEKSDKKDADKETTENATGDKNETNENESNDDTAYKICNDIGEEIGEIAEEVLEDGSNYVIEYEYGGKAYKYEFKAPSGIKYGYIMEGMTSFADEEQLTSIAVYTVDMTENFENYDADMKEKVLGELKEYTEEELSEEFGLSDAMENKEITFEGNKIIIKGELPSGSQKGMMIMELVFDERIYSKMYTYISLVEDYDSEEAKAVIEELR